MSRNRREYQACPGCGVKFRKPIQAFANLLCEDCLDADEASSPPMRATGPSVSGGTTLTEKK